MSSYALVDGQQVSAKDVVLTTRGETDFRCPVCDEQVTHTREYKAAVGFGGNRKHVIVSAHFKHKANSTCVIARAESEQHLLMKAAWVDAYPNAKLEQVLPSGRRADLIVTGKSGREFSVECQHSAITPDEVRGRFKDHNADGLFVNFNFSTSRLKPYNVSLDDGVFDALDVADFRSIVFDSNGESSSSWVLFNMYTLDAPRKIDVPRSLKDIHLVGIQSRGGKAVTPENDLDLLRFKLKGKTESLLAEHTRFVEYHDRAHNGNFENPLGMMKQWAQEILSTEHIAIPLDIPKSEQWIYCEREKRKAKDEADRLYRLEQARRYAAEQAQTERRRQEHAEWQQKIDDQRREQAEAGMRRINEMVAEARKSLQEQTEKETQEKQRQQERGRKLLTRFREVRQRQDEWGRDLLGKLTKIHSTTYAHYELSKIVDKQITAKKNPGDMLLVYWAALEEARAAQNPVGITICETFVMFYSKLATP